MKKSKSEAKYLKVIQAFHTTHSSLYRVFWSSGQVVDGIILILFRHSTTGPEHSINKTVRIE